MAGKKSRDKGLRNEQELVNAFREAGLSAWRVPLSGAAGGEYGGDLRVEGKTFEAKTKANANGFKSLYGWLGNNFGLFVRTDRKEALVVLRLSDFIALLIDQRPKP
jgi:hypothetical protein